MKKFKLFLAIVTMFSLCIAPLTASALEAKKSSVFFTNMNGVELTEQQYKNLSKGFDHDTINTMSQEMIDGMKDDTSIQTVVETSYVKTITKYDANKNIISSNEVNVAKSEYDTVKTLKSELVAAPKSSGYAYHETNYKKITLQITYGQRTFNAWRTYEI